RTADQGGQCQGVRLQHGYQPRRVETVGIATTLPHAPQRYANTHAVARAQHPSPMVCSCYVCVKKVYSQAPRNIHDVRNGPMGVKRAGTALRGWMKQPPPSPPDAGMVHPPATP